MNGTDDYGNIYLAVSKLMQVSLAYNGNSTFTVTITNKSGGTINETPFSPGVWTISYVAGGSFLLQEPVYSAGKLTANALTNIAEAGDNLVMSTYLKGKTGIFTPCLRYWWWCTMARRILSYRNTPSSLLKCIKHEPFIYRLLHTSSRITSKTVQTSNPFLMYTIYNLLLPDVNEWISLGENQQDNY